MSEIESLTQPTASWRTVFDIFMLSTAFMTGLQCALHFWQRSFQRKQLTSKRTKMHLHYLLAFLASVCTTVYTLVDLIYWFTMFDTSDCGVIRIVPGLFLGVR